MPRNVDFSIMNAPEELTVTPEKVEDFVLPHDTISVASSVVSSVTVYYLEFVQTFIKEDFYQSFRSTTFCFSDIFNSG